VYPSEFFPGDSEVPRLELAAWKDRFGLIAGITTRGPTGDYSLGAWSGPEPTGDSAARWGAFRQEVAPLFRAVAVGRQVHGREVRWHGPEVDGWALVDGCDGHATGEPGILLTVSVADCVPVYLADPVAGAIAMLHAGWRGTAAGIVEVAIQLLAQRARSDPQNLVMHCGVSICGDCYEVGPEVASQVTGAHVENPVRLDLRAELARRARRAGVRAVSISGYCAAHDAGLFHSHRASQGRAGRMMAYLGRGLPGA
jgi:YfiH family protein